MRYYRTRLLGIIHFVQEHKSVPVPNDSRLGYLKMLQHLIEPVPVAALTLTSPIQPFEHDSTHLEVVYLQHPDISRDTVIIPMSKQFQSQFLHDDCGSVLVPLYPYPFTDIGKCDLKLRLRCSHLYKRLTGTTQTPPVFKSEKGKHLALLRLKPGKPDYTGLLR